MSRINQVRMVFFSHCRFVPPSSRLLFLFFLSISLVGTTQAHSPHRSDRLKTQVSSENLLGRPASFSRVFGGVVHRPAGRVESEKIGIVSGGEPETKKSVESMIGAISGVSASDIYIGYNLNTLSRNPAASFHLPSPVISPSLLQQTAPVLISEFTSTRAIAIECVTFEHEPFRTTSRVRWSSDQATRVALFAMYLN